jgi:hypothetical protein
MCWIRSNVTVLDRRTMPTTPYPFERRYSAKYDPSCPVMPVINAMGIFLSFSNIQLLNYKPDWESVKYASRDVNP